MQVSYPEVNDINYLTSLREFIEVDIKVIDKYYEVLLKENKTYALYMTNHMDKLQINLEYVNHQIKAMKKKTNNLTLSADSSLT